MSRLPVCFFILMLFLILPYAGTSQTIRDSNSKLIVKISNGEIRDNYSRIIGSINSDGVVRNSSSKKLGTIQDRKVVNGNGMTIFKYDVSETVRDKNGRLTYRIGNSDVRNSSGKLIMKYESIEITHLIGFLCFFYPDV